ncbi:30S ribosomal protein S4 [Candidatus Karelsulcia muelleri]|uniref:30S ribosomal protein S4 n=1 Tax=Candidatus Karelsulcia muelleri TaxID=336810 RepID=UPI00194E44FD|nr:30S ribosomal protein S4 [Candidatus Karelsulcia muelleri]
MARYIGPKNKISRKFGCLIYGIKKKSFEKKKYPPGQHGPKKKTRNFNQSNYSIQLLEKQKIKYLYGILEKQFRKIFEKASKKKGITGEILLQLCESRLDNVVYRLNFAPTRAGARQLVTHRHILVNGKIVNIPSFTLKPGDIISVKDNLKLSENSKLLKTISNWLLLKNRKGIFQAMPRRAQIPEKIKERLVVELYSK